jgi:hypothetical protein
MLDEVTKNSFVYTYNVTSTIRDEDTSGEKLLCYAANLNGTTYYIALNNVYEAGDVITINESAEGIITSDYCEIWYTQPSGYVLQSTTLEFTSEVTTITSNKLRQVLLDVPNYVR